MIQNAYTSAGVPELVPVGNAASESRASLLLRAVEEDVLPRKILAHVVQLQQEIGDACGLDALARQLAEIGGKCASLMRSFELQPSVNPTGVLDDLRKEFSLMTAASMQQLAEFKASPSLSEPELLFAFKARQTECIATLSRDPEFVALQHISDAVEQCAKSRDQALGVIKGRS